MLPRAVRSNLFPRRQTKALRSLLSGPSADPDIEEAAMNWIVKIAKSLLHALTDSYRPELHYMRGPGPKWRTKNPAAC
jgi:hypothetical protein